jgi:hypothetical protein
VLGVNSSGASLRLRPSAIFETPGGPHTLETRLNNATEHYRAWAKSKRHSCGTPFMRNARFTTRWVEGAYPQITQLSAKAAELRSMQYWMRDVCVESHTTREHGSHGKFRAELFQQLVRVEETCKLTRKGVDAKGAPGLGRDRVRSSCGRCYSPRRCPSIWLRPWLQPCARSILEA